MLLLPDAIQFCLSKVLSNNVLLIDVFFPLPPSHLFSRYLSPAHFLVSLLPGGFQGGGDGAGEVWKEDP